jgi:hypothetical protein
MVTNSEDKIKLYYLNFWNVADCKLNTRHKLPVKLSGWADVTSGFVSE